ncbi:MAG: hypothetical protein R3C59_06310 [Planctomycetaceae bacterium]
MAGSLFLIPVSYADDADNHRHNAIIVRSRPVIERLPVQVIHPVDVIVNELGETLIADDVGQVLFRIDADGETGIPGEKLPGISRVVDSGTLGIHVLTVEQRSGRILRLTDNGFQSEVIEFAFLPTGLGVNSAGHLWTTNSATGEVVLINENGEAKTVARLSEVAKDITADGMGAVVLLKSGKIVAVGAGGDTTRPIGYVPQTATRLRIGVDGSVVALAIDGDGRSVLVRPGSNASTVERFAGTPSGTSAFAFDRLGNLTLANPELRAVTRVTSHFTIPCPHCGQPVPMVFSPDAPAEQRSRRSF